MAKKKKQQQQQDGGAPITKKPSLVQKWNDYFKKGDLDDWRRLCADLGLPDDLPSKKQCRVALKSVNVNIKQFLDAQSRPEEVKFFKSYNELFRYTSSRNAFYPKRNIEQGSPLRSLLKTFF